MNPQQLDFSTCPESLRHVRKETTCPNFDPDYGICLKCDGLCKVYVQYLVKEGTAYDLLDFWDNQRSRGGLPLHQNGRS